MVFDPAKVDLSFVEPALRAEVLNRIVVLERFIASRGRAAEREACEALGIRRPQLHGLARAWTARRRAEDVTLKTTKRRRVSSLDQAVIDIISEVADEMPDATARQVEAEVARRALAAGLTPPTYVTVIKYVRERSMARAAETIASIDADLVIDVAVSDMPVAGDDGARVRPNLILVFERDGQGWPVCIGLTTGPLDAAVIADTAAAAIQAIIGGDDNAPPAGARSLRISLPSFILTEAQVAEMNSPHLSVTTREGDAGSRGRIIAAAIGSTIAGYRLRPKLAGRDAAARAAGFPHLAGATPADAAAFLLSAAREGRHAPVAVSGVMGEKNGRAVLSELRRISASARHSHQVTTLA